MKSAVAFTLTTAVAARLTGEIDIDNVKINSRTRFESWKKLFNLDDAKYTTWKANDEFIQKFNKDISGITLPDKFTFPFYYDPHPLAIMAVEELQIYLKEQTNFVHDFGLEENKKGISIGKMFGVLVVENEAKEIGYSMLRIAGINYTWEKIGAAYFDLLSTKD